MPKVTIQLLTWNGVRYLPFLFSSLKKQTYTDWELAVLDNGSEDGTEQLLKDELQTLSRPHRFFKNTGNTGFAGGHNALFKEGGGEYVLFLNQDMYLEPGCLQRLVDGLEKCPEAGVVAPRLMKWNFQTELEGNSGKTTLVDSLGLKVLRNRRVLEKGAGEEWAAYQDFPEYQEVFGVSGALPLFRRQALQAMLLPEGEVFDSSYVSYKEDVDLAFRLRSAGYTAYIVRDAVAYHDRSAAHSANMGDFSAARGKRLQAEYIVFHSYKNQLATLYKNEYKENLILDFPFILWYEIKKFGYFLLFKPSILKGLGELWRTRKSLAKLRRLCQERHKVPASEIRKWFV